MKKHVMRLEYFFSLLFFLIGIKLVYLLAVVK